MVNLPRLVPGGTYAFHVVPLLACSQPTKRPWSTTLTLPDILRITTTPGSTSRTLPFASPRRSFALTTHHRGVQSSPFARA